MSLPTKASLTSKGKTMITTDDKVKRFRSCFICGVELHDDVVVIEDSGKNQYVIDKQNKDAIESFVLWFKTVYLKGIPQVLSIIDYSIASKNADESFYLVNKIVASPSAANGIEEPNAIGG